MVLSSNNSNKNNKEIGKIIIIIIICILIVILIGIKFAISIIEKNYKSEGLKSMPKSVDYENMPDREKITIITQFLGQEVDIDDNSISMSQELVDFLKHARLFNYYGVTSTQYTSSDDEGKAILDTAYWTSEDTYNDEMFKNIAAHLIVIYGSADVEEDISDDLQGEYVWRNADDFSGILCGKSLDNKVVIRWTTNSDFGETENTQSSSEKIKMYTEYEGKYDNNAEVYESYATECFLEELALSEQGYVDAGGPPEAIGNSEWNMSGSFEYNNNYYFCYNYYFYLDSSASHVLVKYDINTEKASIETPLEWLDADIKAAEAELNN